MPSSTRLHIILLLTACTLLSACHEMIVDESAERFAAVEEALRNGNVEKADEILHEITLLDPQNPEGWSGRGMTLTRLGEIEGARTHYEEALSLYEKKRTNPDTPPQNAKILLRKELILLVLLGRSREARERLRETPGEAKQPELSNLIDELENEFAPMILPPPPPETPPAMESDPSF